MNKKTRLKILRFFMMGLLASFLASFLIEFMYSGFDIIHIFSFLQNNFSLFLISTLIFFTLYLWLASLSGSSILGSTLTILTSLLLGGAGFFKFQYRSQPLFPNELAMVTDLPFLLSLISVGELLLVLTAFITVIVLIFIIFRKFSLTRNKDYSVKRSLLWRPAVFILASLGLVHIYHFNEPGNFVKSAMSENAEWVSHNQTVNYDRNGFVAGFLYNLGTEPMNEPAAYSEATIENLYQKYAEVADNINESRTEEAFDTNIIFIMNESFSDPAQIDGFTYDEDPIPYTREVMENTRSGNSLAQGIGGGTVTSEFEAVTGLALEPFDSHIISPYTQAVEIMGQTPSIVRRTKQENYEATAIHPYDPGLYKRRSVYPELGFDTFLHEETMKYQETMENSDFISDESAYKEIRRVMETTDGKDFIHLVTMQNHMPYGVKYEDPDFETSGARNAEEGDAYLQDLHYSDQALEEFIDYINQYDEEVLLVFWGDHLPSVYADETIEQNSKLTLRETPLFFYSNQKDLSGDVGTISPTYYMNHILDILGMKVSPFDAMKMDLEQVLPGIYGGLYLENGNGGQPVLTRDDLTEETYETLTDFDLIQYDIVSGESYAEELGFFEMRE